MKSFSVTIRLEIQEDDIGFRRCTGIVQWERTGRCASSFNISLNEPKVLGAVIAQEVSDGLLLSEIPKVIK
jgi:hypothetical protein